MAAEGNIWTGYLQDAITGFGRLIAEYKFLALFFAVLLYVLICWEKIKRKEEKKMLMYTGMVSLVLLFPVTATFFEIYQTRFYDYEWIWSFVPLTAVLAWGIVTLLHTEFPKWAQKERFLEKKLPEKERSGVCLGIGAVLIGLLLFLCGNMGQLQTSNEDTKRAEMVASGVLEWTKEESEAEIFWGPAAVMQEVRRSSGSLKLFYGRDMWDGKAGAYDYEEYAEEERACYRWMETVSSDHYLYVEEIGQPAEELQQALEETDKLLFAIQSDVDLILLPRQITSRVEEQIFRAAEAEGLQVRKKPVEKYILWILE